MHSDQYKSRERGKWGLSIVEGGERRGRGHGGAD